MPSPAHGRDSDRRRPGRRRSGPPWAGPPGRADVAVSSPRDLDGEGLSKGLFLAADSGPVSGTAAVTVGVTALTVGVTAPFNGRVRVKSVTAPRHRSRRWSPASRRGSPRDGLPAEKPYLRHCHASCMGRLHFKTWPCAGRQSQTPHARRASPYSVTLSHLSLSSLAMHWQAVARRPAHRAGQPGSAAATANVRTQGAIEVLAVCLYHK